MNGLTTWEEESVGRNVAQHCASEPLPQSNPSMLLHCVAQAAMHSIVLRLLRWMQLTLKYLNLELCFQEINGCLYRFY